MGFLRRKIRELFCKNEVKKGNMMVLWRDVDDRVYGWGLNADDEQDLEKVAFIIKNVKTHKLERITGMRRREEDFPSPFEI